MTPQVVRDRCPKGHLKNGTGRTRRLKSGEIRTYPVCLVCRRQRKRDYAARHPDRARRSSRETKIRRYGISPADYDAILAAQRGVCAVCKASPARRPLAIDHKPGRIRGLLCDRCNLAAGLVRDDPAIAASIAEYLKAAQLLPEDGGLMKIALESTTKVVEINGIEARIWQGETDSGIAVHAYITRIAVDKTDDTSQFERELEATAPPRVELAAIPLRLVL